MADRAAPAASAGRRHGLGGAIDALSLDRKDQPERTAFRGLTFLR